MERINKIYIKSNGNLVYQIKLIADRASRSIYHTYDNDDAFHVSHEVSCIMNDLPIVGNVYMVASDTYVGPKNIVHNYHNHPTIVFDQDNGKGWAGNSNPNSKIYHGWRGTTNDWFLSGEGVRKCLKITVTGTRSKTIRVYFGKDLKPNDE